MVYAEELQIALHDLKAVLPNWPRKGEIHYKMGRAYNALRKYQNAETQLHLAKEYLPNSVAVDIDLASTLKALSKTTEAQKVVEAALAQHPGEAELHALLSRLLRYSLAPDALQRMYDASKRACQLRPTDASLQLSLGTACVSLGKLDEAQGAFEKALQLDSNLTFAYQQLATIYRRQGKVKLAEECTRIAAAMAFNDQQQREMELLLQTTALGPVTTRLHLILADRYRDLGRLTLARDEYLAVLSHDPENKSAKNGLAALTKLRLGTITGQAQQEVAKAVGAAR
jgi:tetratricopeptide (TPR) repeat protein